MTPINKLKLAESKLTRNRDLAFFDQFLLKMISSLGAGKMSLKIKYYTEFLYFLEAIAFYIIDSNEMFEALRKGFQAKSTERIQTSFLSLLANYGIAQQKGKLWFISKKYEQLTAPDFKYIQMLVNNTAIDNLNHSRALKKQINGFYFVNELINYYRSNRDELTSQQIPAKWKKLIDNKELDYEIRLAETLKQLVKLELTNKIESPFDDSYYTESGRNAFKNFTKDRFLKCLNHINKQHQIKSVLDIGCGYGNYIEAISSRFPKTTVYGIELQEEVFLETRKRFSGNQYIQLFNKNIFDFEPEKKVDLILLNYVLFYFSNEDKIKLFKQLHKRLNDQGSILICQYYSAIEPLKKQLLVNQNENTFSKRIGMNFGNKILYANALWNESSDAFIESENWNEFMDVLQETHFEISNVTHADPFYYSLFLKITKKPD